jgi:hypothetical protein
VSRVSHLRAELGAVEVLGQLRPRGRVTRLEDTLFNNLRQVAIFELDEVEPALPVLD